MATPATRSTTASDVVRVASTDYIATNPALPGWQFFIPKTHVTKIERKQ